MGDLLGSPRVAPLFFVFIFILTICRVEISIDFTFIPFFIFILTICRVEISIEGNGF